MIECLKCGAFFFTTEGIFKHNSYCIEYNPNNSEKSELSKSNAHTTHNTHTIEPHTL